MSVRVQRGVATVISAGPWFVLPHNNCSTCATSFLPPGSASAATAFAASSSAVAPSAMRRVSCSRFPLTVVVRPAPTVLGPGG
jgi:hypothetical protein